ncbi:MAG: hypothetical protein OXQ92_00880, partial [Boseongicola sp.]|nr:hypothetical protein [Boseongicola sp.]
PWRGLLLGVHPQNTDSVPTNQATGGSGIEEKPSIAIVPLRPLSGDVELEYFADGIAEEIINALSRFHELAVIARNSSFTFKGKSTPAQEIAKSLGVKYVLEGSVRQVAERIRVAVQLVDAEAGHTIWSDRYDGDLSDIFEVQDEIAAKAVNSIAPQTQYAEMASAYRKEMTSLSDWEKVMRARWHMDKYSKEHTEEALQILSNVVGSSSEFAIAHSSMAWCHFHKMLNDWSDDPLRTIREAEVAARRAAELDAFDASALAVLGLAAGFQRRYDECFERLEAAIEVNPNCASAYGFTATMRGCQGDLERTLTAYETAISLSPADPTRSIWMSGKGIALFLHGDHEAVLQNAVKMLRIQPNYGPALRQIVASNARLGRKEEARKALDEVLDAMPGLTISRLKNMVPVEREEHQTYWLDTLRDVGLPE